MKTSLDISKQLKSFAYGTQLRPGRDWLVLLAVAGLLLIGSVVWNLVLFAKVTDGQSIGTGAATTTPHGANLVPVNALFERRATEESRYLNEYRFVDPSKVGG